MTLDPRTPVIVGVGQVNLADGDAPEPVDLRPGVIYFEKRRPG
jgi:hypothetical protein